MICAITKARSKHEMVEKWEKRKKRKEKRTIYAPYWMPQPLLSTIIAYSYRHFHHFFKYVQIYYLSKMYVIIAIQRMSEIFLHSVEMWKNADCSDASLLIHPMNNMYFEEKANNFEQYVSYHLISFWFVYVCLCVYGWLVDVRVRICCSTDYLT